MNILETRSLAYEYPDGTPALRGVNVTLSKRRIAFVGSNGAGKTTLFLHFIGILRPSRGEVLFKGRALRYDKASLLELRRSVGMVFQNPDDQLFAPTVAQDVSFGPKNLGINNGEVEGRVRRALKIAGIEELADKPPHLLSYGQKKRVAIAGVLAMEPEALILDEPLAGLDPAGKRRFIEFLDELARRKTIAVATHNVDFAYEWADYVYVLHRGRVLEEGKPEDIFSRTTPASLSPPKVLEFYEALAQLGLALPHYRPRNLFELVKCAALPGVRVATAEDGLEEGEAVSIEVEKGRIVARPAMESRPSGRIIRKLDASVVVSAKGDIPARGKVLLYPAEGFSRDAFRETLLKHEVDFVGALGSEAGLLAESEGIELDSGNAALERCLLRALAGYTALLLVPRSLSEETLEKIRSYLSGCAAPEIEILKDGG
ncbi:energy-coupling factor ABC transporter ATP-binding protein [Candidatus Pyrohabitans sp.]